MVNNIYSLICPTCQTGFIFHHKSIVFVILLFFMYTFVCCYIFILWAFMLLILCSLCDLRPDDDVTTCGVSVSWRSYWGEVGDRMLKCGNKCWFRFYTFRVTCCVLYILHLSWFLFVEYSMVTFRSLLFSH